MLLNEDMNSRGLSRIAAGRRLCSGASWHPASRVCSPRPPPPLPQGHCEPSIFPRKSQAWPWVLGAQQVGGATRYAKEEGGADRDAVGPQLCPTCMAGSSLNSQDAGGGPRWQERSLLEPSPRPVPCRPSLPWMGQHLPPCRTPPHASSFISLKGIYFHKCNIHREVDRITPHILVTQT